MLPLEQPDRIQIAFDDHRLVANAGLLLPVTLAQRLGRSQLVDRHVDLGRAEYAGVGAWGGAIYAPTNVFRPLNSSYFNILLAGLCTFKRRRRGSR